MKSVVVAGGVLLLVGIAAVLLWHDRAVALPGHVPTESRQASGSGDAAVAGSRDPKRLRSEPQPDVGRLDLAVVDAGSGRPLQAHLAMPDDAGASCDRTHGERFAFAVWSPCRVEVACPGYRSRWVDLSPNDVGAFELALHREQWLGVTVLVDEQPPAQAVAVMVQAWPENRQRRARGRMTDATGRLRLDASGADSLRLTARAPGLAGFSVPVDVRGGQREVVLRLTSAETLAGRVLDEAGEPVPGAEVSAERASADGRPVVGHSTAGPDGRFRIDGLLDGRYRLSARAGLHAAAVPHTEAVEVPQAGDGVVLVLPAAVTTALRLVVDRDVPAIGATVAVASQGDAVSLIEADEEGVAVVARAGASDVCFVGVTPSDGYQARLAKVEGAEQEIVVERAAMAEVSGVATGLHAEDSIVLLQRNELAAPWAQAALVRMRSDEERLAPRSLELGDYEVYVMPRRLALVPANLVRGRLLASFTLSAAGHALELEAAADVSSLHGRVVCDSTGEPLADAIVRIASGAMRRVATTAADGSFALQAPGRLEPDCRLPGWVQVRSERDLRGGWSVRMDRPSRLSVERLAPGQWITLRGARGVRRVQRENGGSVVFDRLPPGDYVAYAGQDFVDVTVAPGQSQVVSWRDGESGVPVRLRLEMGGRAIHRVRRVVARRVGGVAAPWRIGELASSGIAVFEGLGVGDYDVVVSCTVAEHPAGDEVGPLVLSGRVQVLATGEALPVVWRGAPCVFKNPRDEEVRLRLRMRSGSPRLPADDLLSIVIPASGQRKILMMPIGDYGLLEAHASGPGQFLSHGAGGSTHVCQ